MFPFTRALAGAVLVLAIGLAGTASAATPYKTITSAGPLTTIFAGNELSCQVERSSAKQLYPNTIAPGDCGTFAVYDNTLYKPNFAAHGNTATQNLGGGTVVTPVSQSTVSGSGTNADPYKVVTVVTAGAKLRLTQTDSYVTGNDFWTTNVAVKNLTNGVLSTSITRAMDCFLGGSDNGYGFLDAVSGGAGCSLNANNNPVALVEALIPAPGHTVRYYQATYSNVWSAVGSKGDLANTCACGSSIDNGVAVQWPLSLTAQQTQVVSFNTVFDPAGNIPAPPPGLVPPSVLTTPGVDTANAPQTGTPFTATPATWDDSSATQAYQWQRCTSTSTSTCSNIAGATSDSYTPVSGDIGAYLRLVQTATNADGAADATSDLSLAVVAGSAPANVTAPDAGTSATRGTVIHGQGGTWTGSSSPTVRWQRCTSTSAASCSDIAGATALDYTPVGADVGNYLRPVETATNSNGSTEQASAMTAQVAGLPPVNTAPPSLSTTGPAREGLLVSGARGTWTDAVSYAQRWQRCTTTSTATCADIAGATVLDRTPTADDADAYLRLVVTATNPWGSATAYSALGDRVLPAPPAVVVNPGTTAGSTTGAATVTGPLADHDVAVGAELAPDTGTFAHAATLTYQYQRCATAAASSCTDIAGATGSTYRPTAADAGFRLRLVVVATNAGGSVTVATPMTRPVATAASGAPTPVVDAPPAAAPAACVSRRSVTLHWKVPAGQRVAAYSIRLNGKLYATLRAHRHGVNVRMNGRPKQLVVVTVTARTGKGRTLGTTRRYRTCAGNLRGAPLKTLRLVARA